MRLHHEGLTKAKICGMMATDDKGNKAGFSNFDSELEIFQEDTVGLSKKLQNLDVVYLDPPYNQHPYGSNYFMLNLKQIRITILT